MDWANEELEGYAKIRMAWLKRTENVGLRGKVAYEDGNPVGFIQYLPIKHAPVAVVGRDLTFIPCMTIVSEASGKGYGKALLVVAEEDARRTSKGVVVSAFDHDFWYMPASFFAKFGYEEVARRGKAWVLLMKNFGDAEAPRFIRTSYQPYLIPRKVVVEAFESSWCGTDATELLRVREVCAEFGDRVALREYDTSRREVVEKYGITREVFFNGRGKFRVGEKEASKDEIRLEINRALQELTKPRKSHSA